MASIEIKRLIRKHFQMRSKIGCAMLGKTVSVQALEESSPYVGYTQTPKGNAVHVFINPYNELFGDIEKETAQAIVGIDGVIYHEFFHQLFTDFLSHEYFIKLMKKGDARRITDWCKKYKVDVSDVSIEKYPDDVVNIFHQIWNSIEDPSIEYWGLRKYAGDVRKCLRYIIARTYKQTIAVNEGDSAFKQIMIALIQFGDLGVIKGKFTFEEARDAFLKTAPLINQAITSPSAKERIAIAFRVFEDLRPLWQPEYEANKAFADALREFLKKLGLEDSSGSGIGEFSDDAEESTSLENNDETSGRRSVTIEMTKKEFEELKKHSVPGGSGGSGVSVKIKIIDDDSPDAENSEEPGSSGDETSADASKETSKSKGTKKSSETSDGAEEKIDDSKDDADGTATKPSSDASSESSSAASSKLDRDEWAETEIDPENTGEKFSKILESMELTPEDIREVQESINEEINEAELELKESSGIIPDYKISGRGFKSASCKNVLVESDVLELEDSYNTLVQQMSGSISKLANVLKRASQRERVTKTRHTSGRLNVVRYSRFDAKPTVRLFDKRRDPNNCDLAVMVSVDESGSMWGERTKAARLAAIGIAEACAKANIPLYIMGFTADIEGYQAYHLHYVRWKNSKRERINLSSIKARDNNFDGYSIRYASKLLSERPEKNKLLIVISDGQPACSSYRDYSSSGIADTKDAVRQATGNGITVQGIAIGGNDVEVLKSIYGLHFVANAKLDQLMSDLGKAIVKQLKK